MKTAIALFCAILTFSLTSFADRSYEAPNGVLPDQFAPAARVFAGTYKGQFEGYEGEIKISMNGNKPIFSYRGKNGETEMLPNVCESKTGDLVGFGTNGRHNDVLVVLNFWLDTGRCKNIRGGDVHLFFQMKDGVQVIYASIYKREVLRGDDGFEGEYLTGEYKKIANE